MLWVQIERTMTDLTYKIKCINIIYALKRAEKCFLWHPASFVCVTLSRKQAIADVHPTIHLFGQTILSLMVDRKLEGEPTMNELEENELFLKQKV